MYIPTTFVCLLFSTAISLHFSLSNYFLYLQVIINVLNRSRKRQMKRSHDFFLMHAQSRNCCHFFNLVVAEVTYYLNLLDNVYWDSM